MREKLAQIITDEGRRRRLQYLTVFMLLGIISALMTVLNIITRKGYLAWATGVFTVLCAVNFIVMRLSKPGKHPDGTCYAEGKGAFIVSMVFVVEIILLFTFFIVSGNPEGFSAIWVVMLPACGMLLFGRKQATVLSILMFIILIFLFWTPIGRSCLRYEYSATFMMRFPLLYAAFFFLSLLLEIIREATQKQLDQLRNRYEYLSAHDCLTNLLNRQGLMEEHQRIAAAEEQAVFILDIDHFKAVNDSYGHDIGDLTLARVAQLASRIKDARICRWGGEEFVVWFPDARSMTDPDALRQAVENMVVQIPNSSKQLKVTISIGVAKGSGKLSDLIARADKALYRAKENGRNRVEVDA
ncbi:MAG: GGDEF domain-containing protein [Clostridiales bacterium]|nr:GGDEF domain-containing protein [Clostridiales bacterium]